MDREATAQANVTSSQAQVFCHLLVKVTLNSDPSAFPLLFPDFSFIENLKRKVSKGTNRFGR